MDPKITNISEEAGIYKFTLSGINVSLANALRRIILTEIPVVAIKTDSHDTNQCNIEINTTRLHNEIIKQRLSCIPICMGVDELDLLPGKYTLVVDRENKTDSLEFITTEHFRIKNKMNDNYLTDSEIKRIFPPCIKTNSYIDFARLRPKIGDSIPGERLKFTADFSISNAREDSKFNVVSNCTYGFTVDMLKVHEKWSAQEKKLQSQEVSSKDIAFQKTNFYILDAQREVVKDSYDYTIESVGIFENREILKIGANVLVAKFIDLIKEIDADMLVINTSETTMDNCYDVKLEDEDYTMGKSLEYVLYSKHYEGDKTIDFCGFKKLHPHDSSSILRIAFHDKADKSMVKQRMRSACEDAHTLFAKIAKLF